MKQYQILCHWVASLRQVFPHLSKPQAFVLGAFSLGLAWAEHCGLPKIAKQLWFLGSLPTVERRLQRFLANERVDWQQGAGCLARWILPLVLPARATAPERPVVLLVDESALSEHLKVMLVALAYRGHALPLAWWCYPQDQYPLGQVELIDTLLGQVAPALPGGLQVLVEADRGLGCSPDLIAAVERRGWFYLFRVQHSVRLRLEDGREVSFGQMVPRPGRCWSADVRAFKKAGWSACRALGYWKVGQGEPWLLLTNWSQATTADYAVRMWEEHAFRDLKSNGFNWQKSHVYLPAHANRLWLVMALAYAWVTSLGTQVLERSEWWRQLAHGPQSRVSVFQLGLRWLARQLARGKALLYELHLEPQFFP
jgi:hypothetical protein